jgi:hypothetical protein
MTFKTGARIMETSTTTGSGTYTLAGAPVGFQSFSVLGAANHCPYYATDGTDWEEGIGEILTGPNRLVRTAVLASTNAGAAINWPLGTREIRCGPIGSFGAPNVVETVNVAGSGTLVLTQKQQRAQVLIMTGALTGARVLEVDATPWVWIIYNNTTGTFALNFRVTAGSGPNIERGSTSIVACNGSNVLGVVGSWSMADSTPHFHNYADPSKRITFFAAAIASGQTRTFTLPDISDTLVTLSASQSLTTKTINLGNNTLSGSTAQFNAALSDNDFATLAGSETLTGKTISGASNTITNLGQGSLKTTTGEFSWNQITVSHAVAPGGEYGYWPNSRGNVTGSQDHVSGTTLGWNPSTSYAAIWFLRNEVGNTSFIRQRYIQASPPYDQGDGEVALFVFVLVDSSGKIVSTWTAEDPPWANNGPTNIAADFIDAQGRMWAKRKRRIDRDALRDPARREAALAALAAEPELIEITHAVKNADMPLFPHPFLDPLNGRTVVLLDPVSALCLQLRELKASGESIGELLHDDYLRIDNAPLARATPPGVIAVSAQWR